MRCGSGRSHTATLTSPSLPLMVMRSANSILLVGYQLARVHDSRRVEPPLGRPDDLDAELADLAGQPGHVVAADGVMAGDRAPGGDDRVAGRALGRTPLLDLGTRVAPGQEREVERRAV